MFSASYTPPSFSEDKVASIIRDRQQGLYTTEDTFNEALVCVKQLDESTSGDKVFGLIRKHGIFSVFNTNEFMHQVKDWKEMKVVILKCNISEIECGAYGKAWLFTITPPKKLGDVGLCPLALSFGRMVSGFSYISKDKSLIDLAWKYLGSKE
jgi:hypothetical protein